MDNKKLLLIDCLLSSSEEDTESSGDSDVDILNTIKTKGDKTEKLKIRGYVEIVLKYSNQEVLIS